MIAPPNATPVKTILRKIIEENGTRYELVQTSQVTNTQQISVRQIDDTIAALQSQISDLQAQKLTLNTPDEIVDLTKGASIGNV